MSKKLYNNPYQSEYWKAEKEKNEQDNEIALVMSKIVAFFLALGIIFLLFRK